MPRPLRAHHLPLLAALAAAVPAAAQDGGPDLYRQSYAAEARGDYNLALELLQRLPPKAADTYVVHLRSGWLHYLAGRYARSAEAYQQALVHEPSAVEARLGAMLPLMALRRWQDAERVGEEALVLAPGDFTAQSRLAWIQYSQLRYAEAERRYRLALAAYPASADVRTGLGWSLLKLGRFKEAREALEAVLRFAPDQLSAREGLSLVP